MNNKSISSFRNVDSLFLESSLILSTANFPFRVSICARYLLYIEIIPSRKLNYLAVRNSD